MTKKALASYQSPCNIIGDNVAIRMMNGGLVYTFTLPVELPEERSFQVDGRAVVPPLSGGLKLSCEEHFQGHPLLLTVEGLADLKAAKEFAPRLATAIRCASLELGYSLRPYEIEPGVVTLARYNGGTPAVFETSLKARPIWAAGHYSISDHLITLAKPIDASLTTGRAVRVMANPPLAVAVRLFSEVAFAGGTAAKFVVLFSALEVLIPKESGTKRGRVLALVKKTLLANEQTDAKEITKRLDGLYKVRNELLHEAGPVTTEQVNDLAEITRKTLRLLVDTG